jgi:redox-sensitive bicupin YhaK (pirin superfamily)
MLEGRLRHEDHLGNLGLLESGAVQWMTAARGVIHSEMPEQEHGMMRGFQLWLNLPAKAKLGDPAYRDIPPADIPRLVTDSGVTVVVIAGAFDDGQVRQAGAVQRPDTEPLYLDLHLPAGASISPQVPEGHRALLYVYEGSLTLEGHAEAVSAGRLVQLGTLGELNLASPIGGRALLIAGKPLNEPIVQYGPFVMNSHEEIQQALRDFQANRLTA